jgi:methionine synthase II (cobalamin-independent)
MKHSTERILTTHTGSLPRPESLAQLMLAKEQRNSGSLIG